MENPIKYTMFQALRPHFNNLVTVMFIDTDELRSGDKMLVFYNLLRMCGWILSITYNIQYLIQVIQFRHNTDRMVDSLFLLLTLFITTLKQVSLNVYFSRLRRLFSTTEGKLFSPKNAEQVKILDENEKSNKWILFFYMRMVFCACSLQGFYPIVTKYLGQEVKLVLYFPFDTNKSPIFELAVIYLVSVLAFQAYINLLMDCIVAAFYAQTRTQLRLLRYNLEHIVELQDFAEKKKHKYLLTDVNRPFLHVDDCKIRPKIIQCVHHYQLIIWFLREVEAITCVALTGQFLATAWVICMSVYKMVGASFFSTEFWTVAIYLTCMLLQLFFYCYYGTQIKVESDFICQSVFSADWLCMSPSVRRELLIFMNCASRPIIPFAAKIVPISLQSYISVLRASYTLFTVLDKK